MSGRPYVRASRLRASRLGGPRIPCPFVRCAVLAGAGAAPALEHCADELFVEAGAEIVAGAALGIAHRKQLRRQLLELDARRQGHTLAERKHFAGAERRQEIEQVGSAIGNGGAQDRLVALVGHAHRKQGAALRDDGGIELRRPLADEAEEDPVLATLLGNAGDRPAGRPEADAAVGGGVAMRLLAHQEQRRRAFAP